jgi:hypothetical protein
VISNSWQANLNIMVEKNIVTGKNQINDGYQYNFTRYFYQVSNNSAGAGPVCSWTLIPSYTLSTRTTSFTNLSNPILFENKIYPKMIYVPSAQSSTLSLAEFNSTTMFTQGLMSLPDPNIVFYGIDNNGKFYKHMGDLCIASSNPIMPNPNSPKGLKYISNSYFVKSQSEQSCFNVGEGFGLISLSSKHFESTGAYNLTNCQKNGVDYFGQPNTLDIKDNNSTSINSMVVFPNPAEIEFKLAFQSTTEIILTNNLGQIVHSASIEPGISIDANHLPNGVYFLTWKNKEGEGNQKLVVQH